MLAPWKKSYDQPRQQIKKQRHYFANKGLSSQGYGFSSSHVQMWELDYKECWVPKNSCFWTVVLEKPLESPLDCKEIKPVNLKEINLDIHWKDWCLSRSSNTLTTWCEELTHQEKTLMLGKIRAGGERGNRGWDDWIASLTQWTRVWANFRR